MRNLKYLAFFEKFIGLSYFKYPANTRLRVKDQLINRMYDHFSAFQMKLGLWEQQLRTKIFPHFPTLSLQSDVTQEVVDKYVSLIYVLNPEFENQFQNFKKHYMLFLSICN